MFPTTTNPGDASIMIAGGVILSIGVMMFSSKMALWQRLLKSAVAIVGSCLLFLPTFITATKTVSAATNTIQTLVSASTLEQGVPYETVCSATWNGIVYTVADPGRVGLPIVMTTSLSKEPPPFFMLDNKNQVVPLALSLPIGLTASR